MGYMSQERKKEMAAKLKPIMKKYGLKYSLAVDNHSTIVLNIASGPIDFLGSVVPDRDGNNIRREYMQVNPYWCDEHFTGLAREVLMEAKKVLFEGYTDRSDPYSDYHDVSWYVNINVGRWNKPYVFTGAAAPVAA